MGVYSTPSSWDVFLGEFLFRKISLTPPESAGNLLTEKKASGLIYWLIVMLNLIKVKVLGGNPEHECNIIACLMSMNIAGIHVPPIL